MSSAACFSRLVFVCKYLNSLKENHEFVLIMNDIFCNKWMNFKQEILLKNLVISFLSLYPISMPIGDTSDVIQINLLIIDYSPIKPN